MPLWRKLFNSESRMVMRYCGLLLGLSILLIAGCTTVSPDRYSIPFGSIGTDADLYIAVPVHGNEPLLYPLLEQFLTEKNAELFIKRSAFLYTGIYTQDKGSVRIYAAGRYPAALSGLLFSAKDGWQRRNSGITSYHSLNADISMSNRSIVAAFGSGRCDTETFLQNIRQPLEPVLPPALKDAAAEYSSDIYVYIPSAKLLITALAGLSGIELPVQTALLRLSPADAGSYRCLVRLTAPSERLASVVKLLVTKITGAEAEVYGSDVIFEYKRLAVFELVSFADRLLR